MNKETIKLQALVTLDEVSENAINKLLQGQNSFIRSHEKKIMNKLDFIIHAVQKQDEQVSLDDLSGEVLDITSEMNVQSFKCGMQNGASLMLELLQIL